MDAVKFQKRKLDRTYVGDVYNDPSVAEMGVEYTLSNLKDIALRDEEFRSLAEYCEDMDIEFLCSPWDAESVDFLESIDIPFYKIGSPDMTNFVLLEKVIKTGKPIVVSTGMASEEEIERTVMFLEENGAEFGLLHCRSTYPAPFHNLNLSFMERLSEEYDVPVGYSGHERGIAVSAAAAAKGATIIERHFTMDRTMEGPDHAASLEPTGLKKLIRDIRNIEESYGSPTRYLTRGEYNNRVALGKSLVAERDIQAGTEIARDDLTAKSPAKGISPQFLYDVIGNTASRDIRNDTTLTWEDIREPESREFDTDLYNWGVVVRFSDIIEHDWGNPDVYEFRVNGADISADIDEVLNGRTFDKRLGVHAPEQKGHDLVDLSSTNETVRREGVEIIQDVIDLVRETVSPHFETDHEPQIVIHPGGITSNHMELESVPAMNEALKKSMNELDDEGVECLVENMPPLPWIYGGQQYHNNFMRADEIAEYCEETGQKICYDTSHAKLWCNYADVDLVEHAKKLRPYIEYLHVADAAGVDGEGLQIDEGEIDFERLAPVFEDYDGPVITEIWRGHERRGEGFKKAAERLGAYL
ncbi:N-acetylneuraminate synthase [Halogeometricum pallidum JCM 14848]|uniref:N-acetylneuraminate synthase n=1 Tax=Halogeometricum pallidum JCM 14848 TaxID=1227487 RepID=M0CVF0_HALPD|nr:N-acetylneuraminate synthase [Halogeometricum pallidum JCM 14848]